MRLLLRTHPLTRMQLEASSSACSMHASLCLATPPSFPCLPPPYSVSGAPQWHLLIQAGVLAGTAAAPAPPHRAAVIGVASATAAVASASRHSSSTSQPASQPEATGKQAQGKGEGGGGRGKGGAKRQACFMGASTGPLLG